MERPAKECSGRSLAMESDCLQLPAELTRITAVCQVCIKRLVQEELLIGCPTGKYVPFLKRNLYCEDQLLYTIDLLFLSPFFKKRKKELG